MIQAFFNASEPAQLETLDEVLAQRQRERHRLETYHQQQVSQARYDATVARHRYEHVDSDIVWWRPNSNANGRTQCGR